MTLHIANLEQVSYFISQLSSLNEVTQILKNTAWISLMWVGKMSELTTAVSSIFWKMYVINFLNSYSTLWYHYICAQRDHNLSGKSDYDVFRKLFLAAGKKKISL